MDPVWNKKLVNYSVSFCLSNKLAWILFTSNQSSLLFVRWVPNCLVTWIRKQFDTSIPWSVAIPVALLELNEVWAQRPHGNNANSMHLDILKNPLKQTTSKNIWLRPMRFDQHWQSPMEHSHNARRLLNSRSPWPGPLGCNCVPLCFPHLRARSLGEVTMLKRTSSKNFWLVADLCQFCAAGFFWTVALLTCYMSSCNLHEINLFPSEGWMESFPWF